MKIYNMMKSLLLLLMTLVLLGCNERNIKYENYHKNMKSIEPGFHMLGSSNNKYRLKYVGESNSSIESAKEIWEMRAKEICSESFKTAISDDHRVVERSKKKPHEINSNAGSIAGACVVVGPIGCMLLEILVADYAPQINEETPKKYPEIEGTIDCRSH